MILNFYIELCLNFNDKGLCVKTEMHNSDFKHWLKLCHSYWNFVIDQLSDGSSSQASTPSKPLATEASSAPEPAAPASSVNTDLPSHDLVLLPALSPTMTTGTIMA